MFVIYIGKQNLLDEEVCTSSQMIPGPEIIPKLARKWSRPKNKEWSILIDAFVEKINNNVKI